MTKKFNNVIDLFNKTVVNPGQASHVVPATDVLTFMAHSVLVAKDPQAMLAGYLALASQLESETVEITPELKALLDRANPGDLLAHLPAEYIWC